MNEETVKILAAAKRGIIVSGKFNPRTQQVDSVLDGDAAMSLHLLKIQGCEVGKTTFVHPGSRADDLVREYPGQLVLDVGGIDGIEVYDNSSVVIDHHGEGSTAAAGDPGAEHICTAWQLADRLGLADPWHEVPGVIDAVQFIHDADTNKLPQGSFGKSARTILGLSRYFGPEQIIAFFAKSNDLETVLSDSQLEELGLTEVLKKQQEIVNAAFAVIHAAKEVEIPSNEGLKLKGIVVEGQVIGGSFAAYERGYDFYASFTPPSWAVNFPAPRDEVVATQRRLGEGKVIRGSMILCNEIPTEHTLTSFVEAIEGSGNFRPCACRSGEPWTTCHAGSPHCG